MRAVTPVLTDVIADNGPIMAVYVHQQSGLRPGDRVVVVTKAYYDELVSRQLKLNTDTAAR